MSSPFSPTYLHGHNVLLAQPPEQPVRRLVIGLHGYGVDAHFMTKPLAVVQRHMPGALCVAVQAPEICERAPQGEERARMWFSIRGPDEAIYPRMLAALEKFNLLVDGLLDDFGLKESDTALYGFSQGATMALYAGFVRPARYGSVVAHSIMFRGVNGVGLSRPPVLYLYGLNDEIFAPAVFQEGANRLVSDGCEVSAMGVARLDHRTNSTSRALAARWLHNRLG